MAFEFKFPDVGEGITEGEIVKWIVKEGDMVELDQIIAKVETDKAVVDVPSPKAGTILKINFKEGETIKVGEVLVVIGEKGEKVSKAKEKVKGKKKDAGSVVGFLEEAPEEMPKAAKKEITGILATPNVRKLAKDLNVDLNKVSGSGPNGRVTKDDVEKASKGEVKVSKAPGLIVQKKYDMFGHTQRVPLKGIRKTVARNMRNSLDNAAHVAHMDEADVTHLWDVRQKEKEKMKNKGIKLTFLPFLIKAVIAALKEHPYVNASIENEEIVLKQYYNIGIAVDIPDGLVVPVIKGADQKTVQQIAKEIEELAKKARERTLDLMDMKGGTFTITNVGSIGGIFSTPIINYPEAAILAPGRIYDKVAKSDKAGIIVKKVMPLSLSFDHRILDGAEAARFVNKIKEMLENPDFLLVEE
ncbi:2-oxo acid dehydrogenase subunit E2 [Candidatus Woesearchaeota archaeon]|nr:2-oxo acid dehydrogenase subunit E2 [Candidatus Woesearchaeota archaeon]